MKSDEPMRTASPEGIENQTKFQVVDSDKLEINSNSKPAMLSLFKKHNGCLTKLIKLNKSDGIVKDSSNCYLNSGEYTKIECQDVNSLNHLIQNLTTDCALSYGISDADSARVLSRKKYKGDAGTITRTADFFQWPEVAIMMLDYDPPAGQEAMSSEQLHAQICQAMPVLQAVDMLWTPSASSCIYNGDQVVTGVHGQRFYFFVSNGKKIPEIGNTLFKHLWLQGKGHIEISKSGQLLVRTIIDGAVWQPERLDFAAGAVCEPPLTRVSIKPRVFRGVERYLKADSVLSLSPEENAEYENLISRSKSARAVEAQAKKEAYAQKKAKEYLPDNVDKETLESTVSAYLNAASNYILHADFKLHLDNYGTRTVGEILNHKEKYHGETLADPLEPDYGAVSGGIGRCKAKLYLTGTAPIIHSFAHGSCNYRLAVQTHELDYVAGELSSAIEKVTVILASEPDIFQIDAGLVLIDFDMDGMPRQQLLNTETLLVRLASRVQFFKHVLRGGEMRRIKINPPKDLVTLMAKRQDDSGFKPLKGIITAPIIRVDGSVLSKPGYDEITKLLYFTNENVVDIPNAPDKKQIEEAIDLLLRPFRYFPFATSLDKSVLLSAILTAVVRRAIPTAPAYIVSAASAGTGKTILAQCLDIIGGGTGATQQYTHDKDEMRKVLLANLIQGKPSVLFDNVMGSLNSSELCNVLTAESYSGRILGKSEEVTLPVRSLFLFTGNNILPMGDLSRRVLTIYLNAECEHPWQRHFEFDPVAMTRSSRIKLVRAAVILIRGAMLASAESDIRHTGSFVDWSRLVRATVMWLNLQDPEEAISENQMIDQERDDLGKVLVGLQQLFGDRHFTVKDLFKMDQDNFCNIVEIEDQSENIFQILQDSMNKSVTARTVGAWLGYRKSRIVNGLSLERVDEKNGAAVWCIKRLRNENGGSDAGCVTRAS